MTLKFLMSCNVTAEQALSHFIRYLIFRVLCFEPVNEIPPISFRLPLYAVGMELYVHYFYSLSVVFYCVGKHFHRGAVWSYDAVGERQVLYVVYRHLSTDNYRWGSPAFTGVLSPSSHLATFSLGSPSGVYRITTSENV